MAMKIRNRLLVSMLMLTFALLAAAVFLTVRGMERLKKEILTLAVENADSITESNIELSHRVLAKAGERFVEMNSAATAVQLRYMLSTWEKPLKYSKLRANAEIREIATGEIKGFGEKAVVAGRMDLLDLNGEAVIHSNPSIEGKLYRDWKNKFPEMWSLVKRSFTIPNVSGYYTFIDADNHPVRKFMSLSRVRGTPFIVCAVVEIRDFFTPAQKKIRTIEAEAKKRADLNMRRASKTILDDIFRSGAVAAGLLLLFGVLLALWQSKTLASPIRELAKQAEAIGDGDFSAKVAEKGALETRLLARSFNDLGAELAEYMENLKRETAAREAMESEIKVARGIQEAMIPRSERPFPDRPEFDLFASLTPAKEVSGDFYDYFQLDDET
ncbi:MAG: HAMP domain-containing protein, partial [Kiritimatiellaeota bacterium]|nr:HAMP domain-containing protein [Kiritimatiellota bacterium]